MELFDRDNFLISGLKFRVNIKKHMRIVLLVLVSCCLWSCDSNERPQGILSEKEMVPMLIDVYISEGRVSSLSLKRDSSLKVFEDLEVKLFEKYNTTDSIYRASMIYYYDRPKQMEKIYEVVLDSLNLREQRLKDEEKDSKEKVPDDEELAEDDKNKE